MRLDPPSGRVWVVIHTGIGRTRHGGALVIDRSGSLVLYAPGTFGDEAVAAFGPGMWVRVESEASTEVPEEEK